MSDPSGLRFRTARPDDAHAIARLHACSWQRHYRGAYSDEFLDSDVAGYLLPAWVQRVISPHPDTRTVLAEHDGEVVGLDYTVLDDDLCLIAIINTYNRLNVICPNQGGDYQPGQWG